MQDGEQRCLFFCFDCFVYAVKLETQKAFCGVICAVTLAQFFVQDGVLCAIHDWGKDVVYPM